MRSRLSHGQLTNLNQRDIFWQLFSKAGEGRPAIRRTIHPPSPATPNPWSCIHTHVSVQSTQTALPPPRGILCSRCWCLCGRVEMRLPLPRTCTACKWRPGPNRLSPTCPCPVKGVEAVGRRAVNPIAPDLGTNQTILTSVAGVSRQVTVHGSRST